MGVIIRLNYIDPVLNYIQVRWSRSDPEYITSTILTIFTSRFFFELGMSGRFSGLLYVAILFLLRNTEGGAVGRSYPPLNVAT